MDSRECKGCLFSATDTSNIIVKEIMLEKKRLRPENVNKTSDFDSYFQLPDKLWLVCLEDGDIVVNFSPMLLGHAF